MQQADWFLNMAIQVKVIIQSFYTLIGAAVGSPRRKILLLVTAARASEKQHNISVHAFLVHHFFTTDMAWCEICFVTFLKYMYSDKNCFSLSELAHIPYKIKPKTQRHFLTMLLSSLKQIITVKFEETRILFSILHKHYLLFCHVECSSSFVQGTRLHRLVVFL